MRDGYYLSTYLEIDSLAHYYSLGQRHDYNVSLWHKSKDEVRLIHYWELERTSGLKKHKIAFHDKEQAVATLNPLLRPYGLTVDDMEEVWGTPELQTSDDYHSIHDFTDLSYHSIAHLFSAAMFDTERFHNDQILALAVDGGPDTVHDPDSYKKALYCGAVVRKGDAELFPVPSPGPLWMLAAHYFKLEEGSLMALASASNSRILFPVEDAPPQLYSKDAAGLNQWFFKLVAQVDELSEGDAGTLFSGYDENFSIEDNRISMIMKVVQQQSFKLMEETVEKLLRTFRLKPEETYLALSGGFVLNCPSNSNLMRKFGFKGFIAPPCVSDTGLSMGIALYAFYKKLGRFNFKLEHAYYGDRDDSLEHLLLQEPYKPFIKSVADFDGKSAVQDVIAHPVVWFAGAAEIGPRALGHRSIIADPRQTRSKDILNEVKQRQWWRPVAPIILEEELGNWFEESYPSPFMLHTFRIAEGKRELIPAVAHLDDSARIQSVGKGHAIYPLLDSFYRETGVPILCNTSLNDRNEPMINTVEEAINFALRKHIPVAYINGKRVELHHHEAYVVAKPLPRKGLAKRQLTEAEAEQLLNERNPHRVSEELLFYYYAFPELYSSYDLTNKQDVREMTIYLKSLGSQYGLKKEAAIRK